MCAPTLSAAAATGHLAAILSSNRDHRVCRGVCDVLGSIGPPATAAIPALYDELLDNYTAQHAARVIVSIRVQ